MPRPPQLPPPGTALPPSGRHPDPTALPRPHHPSHRLPAASAGPTPIHSPFEDNPLLIFGEHVVRLVPRATLAPEMGLAYSSGFAVVRDDLPPLVRRAVIAHELGHLEHPTWSETRINARLLRRDPAGFAATALYALLHPAQRAGTFQILRQRLSSLRPRVRLPHLRR